MARAGTIRSFEHKITRLESLGLYLNKPKPAIICRHCKYALEAFYSGRDAPKLDVESKIDMLTRSK